MNRIFVSFLLVALTVGAFGLPAGTLREFPGLIVGGQEASLGSIPFQISINRVDFGHWCGGSIYNSKWIITAAHCVNGDATTDLKVFAGIHNVVSPDPAIVQEKVIKRIIVHPDYRSASTGHDVALLELEDDIILDEAHRTGSIKLAADGSNPTGSSTVSGWGDLSSGGSSPAVLMTVNVPLVGDDVCNKAYGGRIDSTMICAGIEGKDSCQGDSGGPLVWKNAEGETVLIGIVSWGTGCASAGYPGVYSKIPDALGSWIVQTAV